MEFLLRNKKWFGLAFSALGMYVWNWGCPGLEPYCAKAGPILTSIGSFLVGAGVLPSDYRSSISQGKTDPSVEPPVLDKLA